MEWSNQGGAIKYQQGIYCAEISEIIHWSWLLPLSGQAP